MKKALAQAAPAVARDRRSRGYFREHVMLERKSLAKVFALGAGIMDPALTKAELKLLWELLEHSNDKQIAWPSTRTLARLTAIDHRNLGRHLTKLINAGYLDLVQRGTWNGASSRYLLTYKGAEAMWERKHSLEDAAGGAVEGVIKSDNTPAITGDDTPPVIKVDDTLSSPVTQPVITSDDRVSSPVTTEPPNEPAYKAGELVVEAKGGGPTRDGAFGAALAVAPDQEKNSDGFAKFMAAYPLQIDVDKAEAAFDTAVASGQRVDFLIAQAAAYAVWCKTNRVQQKYITRPANWLRNKRWRDRLPVDEQGKREASRPRAGGKSGKVSPAGAGKAAGSPKPSAGESYMSEESEAARAVVRAGFLELQGLMNSVEPGVTLGDQLRSLAAYAHENDSKSFAEITGGDAPDEHLFREIDSIVGEVARGEWGDVEGFDSADQEVHVSRWFWPRCPDAIGWFFVEQAKARLSAERHSQPRTDVHLRRPYAKTQDLPQL